MHPNAPIVLPVRHANAPELGPVTVVAATQGDLNDLRKQMDLPDSRHVYMSRLYHDKSRPQTPSLVGPVLGAPYAVMLLETLRVWGLKTLIFVGWCGSIQSGLNIGDILLPRAALVDEGTSLHYGQHSGNEVRPDRFLSDRVSQTLISEKIAFQKGAVWTTDGVFRETPAKVDCFEKMGAMAVEMELSALLSAAHFHKLSIAGVLVVSDELFLGQWNPGFKDKRFIQARQRLVHGVVAFVNTLV